MLDIASVDKKLWTLGQRSGKKISASNRSTNAKAAQLQPTSKAFASVLLSNGRLRHCA